MRKKPLQAVGVVRMKVSPTKSVNGIRWDGSAAQWFPWPRGVACLTLLIAIFKLSVSVRSVSALTNEGVSCLLLSLCFFPSRSAYLTNWLEPGRVGA